MELFTIGHSNHTIESFISLLQQHGITALADVRSHPYSRFLSHFKRQELKEALARVGIYYVFLGKELGARPDNSECYINGKAVYEKIAATDTFGEGIQKILQGSKKYHIALMCAEKDPLTCHRAILVCQHLRQFDLEINHILKNGDLESHHHLEDRMLAKHSLTKFAGAKESPVQLSLFEPESTDLPTREECLAKAYILQGDEIAYVEKEQNEHE
ncbi:MAG: DUF488 domain-containing protein [Symploca sp. SIO2E6]|nr:DUF488 domain-containing protein [Symploca sp. SIO2E6]